MSHFKTNVPTIFCKDWSSKYLPTHNGTSCIDEIQRRKLNHINRMQPCCCGNIVPGYQQHRTVSFSQSQPEEVKQCGTILFTIRYNIALTTLLHPVFNNFSFFFA